MKVKLEVLKRMLAIPALLLTTLEEMNPQELKTFQWSLTSGLLPDCPPIPERQLENADRQDTVDQMVKTYGPERVVEITLMILRGMKRVDLAEKLETDHRGGTASTSHLPLFPPRPRSVLSPVWLPPISPLLSRSSSSFGSSKKLLSLTSPGSSGQLRSQEEAASEMERKPAGEESGETPQQPSSGMWTLSEGECHLLQTEISWLEVKLEVLKAEFTMYEKFVNMDEQFPKLPRTSFYGRLTLSDEECRDLQAKISRLEEKLRFMKRPFMLDFAVLLLTTLEEMNPNELKTFQSFLTSVQLPDCPPIPESQLENADRQVTVDQMVKTYAPNRAVEITLRILRGMNQNDLAEKLERDYNRALLLTTLEELTEEQLKTFQSDLSSVQLPDCPPIPESQLENTDRQVIVDQMVKRYDSEGAVEITLWILRRMNLDLGDLAEKLERDHRGILQATQKTLKEMPSSSSHSPPRTPDSPLLLEPNDPIVGQAFTLPSATDGTMEEESQDCARVPPSDSLPEAMDELSITECRVVDQSLCTTDPPMRSPENFKPEIYYREGKGAYRFQCPSAGLFQCSITGLVFRMEGEGEVLYRTVPWNRRLLAQSGKRPAGPLFKFTCLKESVCQLHLPHCEIHSVTTRTTVQDRILETLEELDKKELNKFQWHLSHLKSVNGFTPIPKSQLKKAERHDTVDKMVQRYGPEETLKISVNILTKMHRNDLSDRLQNNH
ncbi:hypothetical protein J4Q44_G00290370 [Coregonus suidteri]|uniref:Pyrin domain-containing protein n=1 Tax=Coregonus suidteri TaxID=861788 RepID=A0AAN8KTS3_9TELE